MKVPASLALLIVAASGSTGAAAQYAWQAREAAQVQAATDAKPVQTPKGSGAGFRVFIDPVTREIRQPEPEELQALARQLATLQIPPVPQMFTTPSGATGVILDPSFDSYMLAARRPNGTLAVDCLPGQASNPIAAPIAARPVGTFPKTPAPDEK